MKVINHLQAFILFCLTIMACTNKSDAQPQGKTNLSRFSHVILFIDLDTEIPNTLLQTPVTSTTVADYVTRQFKSNGIPCSIATTNQGTPLMLIRLTTFSLQVGDCSVTCLNLVCYLYESYDGKRFISWGWDKQYLTVNLKGDGKASGVWENLGILMNDFTTEWKQTH